MTALRVDATAGTLHAFGRSIACTIGRSGACSAEDKREGDGRTPLGTWPIRCILFHPGRAAPPPGLALPWRWIGADDGWSDDIADPAYNRPVRHPHPFSAEHLVREDGLYDAVVILGHNDAPPVPGLGSAIFLHCSIGGNPTEGCVAIPKDDLLALLIDLKRGDSLEIT